MTPASAATNGDDWAFVGLLQQSQTRQENYIKAAQNERCGQKRAVTPEQQASAMEEEYDCTQAGQGGRVSIRETLPTPDLECYDSSYNGNLSGVC